jgi:hypothetical protein
VMAVNFHGSVFDGEGEAVLEFGGFVPALFIGRVAFPSVPFEGSES